MRYREEATTNRSAWKINQLSCLKEVQTESYLRKTLSNPVNCLLVEQCSPDFLFSVSCFILAWSLLTKFESFLLYNSVNNPSTILQLVKAIKLIIWFFCGYPLACVRLLIWVE